MAGVQVKPFSSAESSEIDLTEMKKKMMARDQIKSLFVPLYILYNLAEQTSSYQNTVFTESSMEQRNEGLDGIAGES